jgi:hypothetical protein
MAQEVSRRPLTAEARVRSRVSPCGIYGGQIGTGTVFSPSTSVFPCHFQSTGAPLHGKTKKLIIFITGLHNKTQGCGASIASAAGPFTTKKSCGNHIFLVVFRETWGYQNLGIFERCFYDIKFQNFLVHDTSIVPAWETLTPCVFIVLIEGNLKNTSAS